MSDVAKASPEPQPLKDAEPKKSKRSKALSPKSVVAEPPDISEAAASVAPAPAQPSAAQQQRDDDDVQLRTLGADCASHRIINPFGGTQAVETGVVVAVGGGSLHQAVCEYGRKHGVVHSLSASKASADEDSGDESSGATAEPTPSDAPAIAMRLGFGQTTLEWEGRQVRLTLQAFGDADPMSGYYHDATLSSPASGADEVAEVQASLRRLCQAALTAYETAPKGSVTLYSYHAKFGYWRKDRSIRKRALGSVVLPEKATSAVLNDARLFLDAKAREWYAKFSIPYKRTFLLFGPPGCGKSTLIGAVASEFDLNVCMLSLADPDLKDNELRRAIQSVPKRSVVCLEDCDAIFNHHRQKEEPVGCVTFSGLLNALDGIGDPHGTMFFLTTNHRERLDKALIRPGRCDVQVPIEHANDDQIMRTLVRFYDGATPEQQKAFVAKVRAADGGRRVSMAALQEHFVQHRLSTLEQALGEIKLGANSTAEGSGSEQMWS